MGGLSEDLQSFLMTCELEFAERYTEEDVEYKKHCDGKNQNVPIEERWFVRPPRAQYDNRDDRGGRRGHWDNRGHQGHHYQNDGRNFRRDRENYGWRQRDRYNDRSHQYSRNSDRNQQYSRNYRY